MATSASRKGPTTTPTLSRNELSRGWGDLPLFEGRNECRHSNCPYRALDRTRPRGRPTVRIQGALHWRAAWPSPWTPPVIGGVRYARTDGPGLEPPRIIQCLCLGDRGRVVLSSLLLASCRGGGRGGGQVSTFVLAVHFSQTKGACNREDFFLPTTPGFWM